jgi:hypothetical protein
MPTWSTISPMWNRSVSYEHSISPVGCSPSLTVLEVRPDLPKWGERSVVTNAWGMSSEQAQQHADGWAAFAEALREHEAERQRVRDEQPAPEPALAAVGGE